VSVDLALADPAAELAYRWQLAREAYRRGVDDGRRAGVAETVDWYKRLLTNTVADAQLEQRRRHLCCGPCRRTGHRHGCPRCEDRGRETYASPHPDDYPGQDGAA
jgi:hypothetical protein